MPPKEAPRFGNTAETMQVSWCLLYLNEFVKSTYRFLTKTLNEKEIHLDQEQCFWSGNTVNMGEFSTYVAPFIGN